MHVKNVMNSLWDIRIFLGLVPKESPCRSLLKQLDILPVPRQYIFSRLSFSIINQEIFKTNSSLCSINTRYKHRLLRADAHLSYFQKSTYYAGRKFFNGLPPGVTIFKNDEAKFKTSLRKYLNTHFCYSVGEFFMCKDNLWYCFGKMFVVFYTVNIVYGCVIANLCTSYCLRAAAIAQSV